jgi:hypothetical protein
MTLKLLSFSNEAYTFNPHERDIKSYDSFMKAFDEYEHSKIKSLRKKNLKSLWLG